MKIRVCSTLIEPREVLVQSSRGDHAYSVSAPSLFNEAVCECPGYIYRGKCRHRDEVVASACTWVSADEKDASLGRCPKCGELAEDFDTEPVYT